MSEHIILKDNKESFFSRLEAILFPLLAGVIGIGYTVAIFVNNPLIEVLTSPHAIILIIIFISIAYFPLRSIFQSTKNKNDAEHD